MVILALIGCLDPEAPGALVPPTVDQDPALPSLQLEVAGRARLIHHRASGDPADPTVLVLHGSGSDHRAWRFLEALSDRYHVVLWDQRGAGLSERITEAEISWDASVEELDALVDHHSPQAPVHLVGHSWGGMLASLYLSRRPERVDRVVLVEPGPLTGEVMQETFQSFFQLDLADTVLNEQQWATGFLGPGDHARLDYAYLLTLQSPLVQYHCDPEDPPDWPLWRAGAYLEAIRQRRTRSGGRFVYDFADGLAQLQVPVLVVGTSCSALGTELQERWHLPLLPEGTELIELQGAGHRLPAEQPGWLLEVVGAFLDGP